MGIGLAVDWIGLLPVAVALGTGLVLLGVARLVRRSPSSRLAAALADADVAEERDLPGMSPYQRFGHPLLQHAGRLASRAYPTRGYIALERALTVAGNPTGWGAREFIGLRAITTLGCAVAGLAVSTRVASPDVALVIGLALGVVGHIVPGMWLQGRIGARQRAIERDLADVLDMLSLCLDAGLGLEGAMGVATRRWRGPLTGELRQVLSEVQLGWPRQEALRRMVQRTDVAQLSAFVSALIQADQLGTSVRNTLTLQAIEARSAHRRRVREAGYRAPIRMIIPMTLFILPAMFIVIIGPAVPEMARSLLGG